MAESLSIEPTADEAAELQASINQILAEIDQLQTKMRRDQAEIERSRIRTQAMLRDLATMFQTS
jgi:molecular chaperone GrpE (heat shock protein)